MNQKTANWTQQLDSEAVEEYNALRRSLQRNNGFGLFFVQCSPATGEAIVNEIKQDIKQKKIETLRLTKPIDSLYNIIQELPNVDNINILFISGLEHSLYEYEETTFGNKNGDTYTNSKDRYTQSRLGVPRFLGYLNLQRERFKEAFNISFVFLLPSFGINYFIKRAPDFFDWRSGLFRFVPNKDKLTEINSDIVAKFTPRQSEHELLELKALRRELKLSNNEEAAVTYKQLLLSLNCQRYEDTVIQAERLIKCNLLENINIVWDIRGIILSRLGKYEEAVVSYDRALEINPDDADFWFVRGFTLEELKRYEEAVASYDRALEINPDDAATWRGHGFALAILERYEEAITSFDRALEINPDDASTWYIHGTALGKLERYEEAVASYDRALEINPDDAATWRGHGFALTILERYEEAITSFDRALEINPDDAPTWYNRGVALGGLKKSKAMNLLKSWIKSCRRFLTFR